MLARLLLFMTVIPAVELYLLIQLGQWMGPAETVLLIVLTGVVGATLAKREGLGVLRQLQEEARRGIPPADRLVEGLLVLIGGILLITPGVLTDLTGLLLIAPPSRRFLAPRVKGWVMKRISIFPGPADESPSWGGGRRSVGPSIGEAEEQPGEGRGRGDPGRWDHPTS